MSRSFPGSIEGRVCGTVGTACAKSSGVEQGGMCLPIPGHMCVRVMYMQDLPFMGELVVTLESGFGSQESFLPTPNYHHKIHLLTC